MNTRILLPLLCAAPFFASVTSCASTAKADGGQAKMEDTADKKDGKDAEEKKHELEDKQRELHLAQMNIGVQRTKATHSTQEAEEAAQKAQVEVEQAEKALTLFREIDKPKRAREMELRVIRAENSIDDRESDLKQMVDDYEGNDEYYAQRTGEIVVTRTRRSLDLAKASLELTIQSRDKLMAHTLPDEEAELVRAVALKKSAQERAEQQVDIATVEAQMSLIKAEAKIEKLEREVKAADKELAS